MNEARPLDTISNDLMAMRHAHEVITITLKSGEYNGEIVSSKEQKKLPQVDYRVERAIEIGEFLDKVVGNVPYRAYGVLAASYRLLCCNLNQRIKEIDEDKKPSEYASPRRLIPPKDVDIKNVEKCKDVLSKWLANKKLERYVESYKEDIDRLDKLVDFRDNQFKNQKNYPGDKLVFSPFPDSVLYYANQLFHDCWTRIMTATGITPDIDAIAKYVAEEDKFSTAYIQGKFRKGHGFVYSLGFQWEYLGIVGSLNGSKPRELLIKPYDDIIATIEKHNSEIRKIIKPGIKPAGKTQTKSCGMDDALREFEMAYKRFIISSKYGISKDKELSKVQSEKLKELELYWRQILDISTKIVITFDFLNYYQKHFGERRYARSWLKFGLSLVYDKVLQMFYQTLDSERFKNWCSCRKPKTPDVARGNVALARKDISGWLNDEKAMKYLRDFEYDMEQALQLKEIKQIMLKGQSEEYRKIVKPICDSFDEFINITHYNCQEILQDNNFLK